MREQPKFYYSRIGSEGSLSPDVPWTPVPDEFVEALRGLDPGDEAFTISYPFDQAGASGRGPRPGDSIRIVAPSRTDGRTAGTTIIYPESIEEVARR